MGTRARRTGRSRRFIAVVIASVAVATTGVLGAPAAHAAKLDKVTIGYSAWPGWFPLAVAQKEGIFKKNGLDVNLKYFADYVSSLDAMSAGKLDANTQTLNDTMAAVAGGSKQAIIVVNDNSAGNDAIICDESIKSVADMKGKTVAAEEGVVDHFLLLQGLAKEGLTQDDIDFRGVLTADAAASFSGGQFDCVGVFAPFTLEALKRPGSHVVFSSRDFPGSIPDHIVVSQTMVAKQPKVAQKIVNAWYDTLDFIGPRNQLRFPTYARLELGVEHRFKIFKLQPWIGVRAYNALNAFLPTDVQANIGSRAFGSFYNSEYRQFRLQVRFER